MLRDLIIPPVAQGVLKRWEVQSKLAPDFELHFDALVARAMARPTEYEDGWDRVVVQDVRKFRVLYALACAPLEDRKALIKRATKAGLYGTKKSNVPDPDDAFDDAWKAAEDVRRRLDSYVEEGNTVPQELAEIPVLLGWGEVPPIPEGGWPVDTPDKDLGDERRAELGDEPPDSVTEVAKLFNDLAAESELPRAERERILRILLTTMPGLAPILVRGFAEHETHERGFLFDIARDLIKEVEVGLRSFRDTILLGSNDPSERDDLADMLDDWTAGLRDRLPEVTSRTIHDDDWETIRRAYYEGGVDSEDNAFAGILPWLDEARRSIGLPSYTVVPPEPTLIAVLSIARHLPRRMRQPAPVHLIRSILEEIRDHVRETAK